MRVAMMAVLAGVAALAVAGGGAAWADKPGVCPPGQALDPQTHVCAAKDGGPVTIQSSSQGTCRKGYIWNTGKGQCSPVVKLHHG